MLAVTTVKTIHALPLGLPLFRFGLIDQIQAVFAESSLTKINMQLMRFHFFCSWFQFAK